MVISIEIALHWTSVITRILSLFAVSLICCTNSAAEQFDNIVGECWKGRAHPQMSACVAERAAIARARLDTKEKEIRDAIAKNKENPSYTKAVVSAFEASVISFRKYRDEQCFLVFSLASKGNGAEDNKMACETQLDIERTEQLQAGSWWISH